MLLKAYSSSISASLTQAFTDFWDNILEKSPSIFIGLLFLALFTLLGFGLRSLVKKRFDKGTHDPLLISFIGP
jgi:uncharacterized membrane protein YeiB